MFQYFRSVSSFLRKEWLEDGCKVKSALRCLLTCPPPHLPDMFVQNWVDVEARRKSDAKSTFYDHFLQSRSKVPEKAPSNWQNNHKCLALFPSIFQIWQHQRTTKWKVSTASKPSKRAPERGSVEGSWLQSLTTHSDKVIWVKYFRSCLKDSPTKHL